MVRNAAWQLFPRLIGLPAIRVGFERCAIPAGTNCFRFVGVLQKFEKHIVGVGCPPHNLIRQEEFTVILAVVGLCGSDRVLGEAVRLGVGVGVEGTFIAASRPEPAAAQFVRISLDHYPVAHVGSTARMAWRVAAGKPSAREIHCAPEELHGTHFSDETRPELTEYAVGLEQLPPE